MTPAFPTARACTRRCSTTASCKDTGVSTLDFAKAMIDEGYPPDDHVLPAGRARRDADRADRDRSRKASLDLFIAALRSLAERAKSGTPRALQGRAALRPAPPPRRDARRAQAGAGVSRRRCTGAENGATTELGAVRMDPRLLQTLLPIYIGVMSCVFRPAFDELLRRRSTFACGLRSSAAADLSS